MFIISYSIIDYVLFIQNINVRYTFKSIKNVNITLRGGLFGYGINHFLKKNIFSSTLALHFLLFCFLAWYRISYYLKIAF